MSFKPFVSTIGDDKFYGNALAFATEAEALDNARDLFQRWMLCTGYRAIESDEPVSHAWVDGQLLNASECTPTTSPA